MLSLNIKAPDFSKIFIKKAIKVDEQGFVLPYAHKSHKYQIHHLKSVLTQDNSQRLNVNVNEERTKK